ncbi:hypothetical protein YN1_1270 [Nanoarchaeota archaeon]
MNKRDILISVIIFVVVFFLVYSILYLYNHKPINITFYPDPYNYTVNFSNSSIQININDLQLPYINTSKLFLNVSGNIYYLDCKDKIIYQNQSTICIVNNINLTNVSYIQLLYPYNHVLYNIVYEK